MSEIMVERVAAAMQARRMELIDRPLSRCYGELARAAIGAMQEPSEGMISARFQVIGQGGKAEWEAMIDAALSEPTTRERRAEALSDLVEMDQGNKLL